MSVGFECLCGERHLYPAYVFAHWDEQLSFTCSKCGIKYYVLRGNAKSVGSSRAAKAIRKKK